MKFIESVNWPITVSLFLLLSVGIAVISSSSISLGLQQAAFAVVGLILFIFIASSDYRTLTNLIKPAYFLCFFLLILVFIFGVETRGSIRWIPIGPINIQPSEFAKPAIILFLADFWSKRAVTWASIVKSFLWLAPVLALVFKQPDLGTTITLTVIWLGSIFAAGISFKKTLILFLIIGLTVPLGLTGLAGYQRERLTSFLSPQQDPLGVGYNIIQSTIAVGSGQLLGRGLGQGTQSHLQFLPEFRTDFIFAAISEELGFLGSVGILVIYFCLISYVLKISVRSPDLFGYLVCFGVAVMLFSQTAINIGMSVGLVPITGVTLPLISYGGSSLISTLISLGLVASVAKLNKFRYNQGQ